MDSIQLLADRLNLNVFDGAAIVMNLFEAFPKAHL